MTIRVFPVLSLFCLLLTACGERAQPGDSGAAAEIVLNRGNAGEPNSLDHQFSTTSTESAVITDLMMGLTTAGADGNAIPGAAESWETSDDGLIWTFHLRDHNWSDGMPVTADDFVYAWQRLVNPDTAAPYAAYVYIFENARAIAAGEMPPETLGARAIDERTLELRLETPAPYLPEMLEHATTYPLARHVVEALGDDWARAGNYVGNGPYKLVDWLPGDRITLVKNDAFYDAANVQIDRVIFHPINDVAAGLRRFRAGELDTLDGFPMDQIDWLRTNMPNELRIGPALLIACVVMNQNREPFNDVRVREALNLAYDRDTITQNIIRMGQEPAYSIVPPGVANYPGPVTFAFKDMPYADRVARAQQLMQEAGYGPDNRLSIEFSAGPTQDARVVAAAVQQMWREIYVDTEIVQAEGRVRIANMQSGDYDVGPYGWIGDFNDAYNFLFLLMTENQGLNYTGYSNPAFDALMHQANLEQDLVRRGDLMAQAERIALNDSVWIPTRYEVTEHMVHTYVKNWITNINDENRTRWLSIER